MNSLKKLLKKKQYCDVYENLKVQNYSYSLDSIERDFSDIDDMNMYCYLLYVLSKENTCEKHILICDYLLFSGTFFYDVYSVIYWHLKLALNLDAYNYDVLNWIIDIFYKHPDSPFAEHELVKFAESIILVEPYNLRAQEILKI